MEQAEIERMLKALNEWEQSGSLGPGQRFASRGGYVARFPGTGESILVPVSEWVVP